MDLGIRRKEIREDWPIHAKPVDLLNYDGLSALAGGTLLEEPWRLARRWVESAELYGANWASLKKEDLPAATFSTPHLLAIWEAGKIEPCTEPIQSFVNGFKVAEVENERWRPIFEPVLNASLHREALIPQRYPSRLQRRWHDVGATHVIELDMKSYFDQFPLHPSVRRFFALRTRNRVPGQEATLWQLTRMPMGASFAPGVAQTATAIIVWPLLSMRDIRVDTMLDNIRIASSSPEMFCKAIRIVIQRCAQVNATLKNFNATVSDEELIRQGAIKAGLYTFLGEEYITVDRVRSVRNTKKCIENLGLALERLRSGESTRRQCASLVGLIVYMTHTIAIRPSALFRLLRFFRAICRGTDGALNFWDQIVPVSSSVRFYIEALSEELLRNKAVPITPIRPPSSDVQDYGVAIIVDASLSGWGALIWVKGGKIFEISCGWPAEMQHSAHAEPCAALAAVKWTKAKGFMGPVALVTDHQSVVTGQSNWSTGFGGYSSSFYLNEFYDLFHEDPNNQVFYVNGPCNPADPLSRNSWIGQGMRIWQDGGTSFPSLKLFEHPFLKPQHREIFQV